MKLDFFEKLLILAIAWVMLGGTVPWPALDAKATAVTYFYEKDESPLPPAVLAGINRLNREAGIVASVFEDDTTDGGGDIPSQYAISLPAAREAGLPVLVVTAGHSVLRLVKDPQTEAEVMGAVGL